MSAIAEPKVDPKKTYITFNTTTKSNPGQTFIMPAAGRNVEVVRCVPKVLWTRDRFGRAVFPYNGFEVTVCHA